MRNRTVLCRVIMLTTTLAVLSFGTCLASSNKAEVIKKGEASYAESSEKFEDVATAAAMVAGGAGAIAAGAGIAYIAIEEKQKELEK